MSKKQRWHPWSSMQYLDWYRLIIYVCMSVMPISTYLECNWHRYTVCDLNRQDVFWLSLIRCKIQCHRNQLFWLRKRKSYRHQNMGWKVGRVVQDVFHQRCADRFDGPMEWCHMIRNHIVIRTSVQRLRPRYRLRDCSKKRAASHFFSERLREGASTVESSLWYYISIDE